MSVLVFIEGIEGEIKKSSIEACMYASELAKKSGEEAVGVAIGNFSSDVLQSTGESGLKRVLYIDDAKLKDPLAMPYASVLEAAAAKENSKIIVMAKSAVTDSVASRLAIKLKAGLVTNVLELPDMNSGFIVKKAIYSGKAFVNVEIKTPIKIITIAKNAFVGTKEAQKATIESFKPVLNDNDFKVSLKETQKTTGDILLPEADIVVSGGRGLKGPENWPILLDLAKSLGAATGCSKPVSDLDWRPHHEHVGQTGVKVSPNIYIAIGISGAIQHLAGVNASKVIVVINKDPEAPFFKAADYGIVGDLFEIVPKLTAAAKALK